MNTAAKTKQYSCDICDHGEFEEIRVHKTPIGDLRVVKCLNCGHFYQKDRASIEYIKELYESDYFTNAYEDFNEGVTGSYLEDREQIMTFVRRRFNEIENLEKLFEAYYREQLNQRVKDVLASKYPVITFDDIISKNIKNGIYDKQ